MQNQPLKAAVIRQQNKVWLWLKIIDAHEKHNLQIHAYANMLLLLKDTGISSILITHQYL